MGASLALDATINNVKKDKQTYQIPIPRVTVYDVELKQKDGFTIEAFNKMLRRKGNLVQLNSSWEDGDSIHPARHGKCVDNVITVLENDNERVYKVTNAQMLEYLGGRPGIDRISGFIYIGHKVEEPNERRRPDPEKVVSYL